MAFTFKAVILKTGINPYVDVPGKITAVMTAVKGYIPIKGTINKKPFYQTLVPVKNGAYRLYVNGPMCKVAGVKPGDTARFSIEQNLVPREFPIPKELKTKLAATHLMPAFKQLSTYRQKEIIKYLSALKTAVTLAKNIDKVIELLSNKKQPALPVWLQGKTTT